MFEKNKPQQAEKGQEVIKSVRPDQIPIAGHVESFEKGHLKEPEIATIERKINALVERDYVEMLREPDSKIAAIFFASRKAHRLHGIGIEAAELVGPKHKETRWGKLMLTKIGMDLAEGRMKVTVRPLLEKESKTNDALQDGMRAAALYLKGVYGWDKIPEYSVVGAGVSGDDIEGHDHAIREARRAAIDAGKPVKKIEHKK